VTPDQIRTAAEALIEARNAARALATLPDGSVPQSIDDGYAIQEATANLCGWPLAGYKIGCTSEHAQEMLGADSPFPGRVFRTFVHSSPAACPFAQFVKPGVEGEFAFELADDIPSRPRAWTRAEVEARVAHLMPAIEIIDTRFDRFAEAGVPNLVADTGANGGLVLGKPITDWAIIDLENTEVVMKIDGQESGRGFGRDVLGHPLEALTWLANDLSRRGYGLLKGQVVTTGTCTGMQHVPAGKMAKADFGKLGTVSITFDR